MLLLLGSICDCRSRSLLVHGADVNLTIFLLRNSKFLPGNEEKITHWMPCVYHLHVVVIMKQIILEPIETEDEIER